MADQQLREDLTMQTRWLLERMERDQDECRQWQDEWRQANAKSSSGISRQMTAWLIARTVVELLIFFALVWRMF